MSGKKFHLLPLYLCVAAGLYPILQLRIDRIGTHWNRSEQIRWLRIQNYNHNFSCWPAAAHTLTMRSWIVGRAAAGRAGDGAIPVVIFICVQFNHCQYYFFSYNRHRNNILDGDAEGQAIIYIYILNEDTVNPVHLCAVQGPSYHVKTRPR